MNKRLLVRHFNSADVVFDRFKLGALGTIAPEAMSSGRPVVSYVKPELWTPWHKKPSPVANAPTAQEIYRQMVALENEGLRKELGVRGRWGVRENCEMTEVAENQLRICEEIVRNWRVQPCTTIRRPTPSRHQSGTRGIIKDKTLSNPALCRENNPSFRYSSLRLQ